MATQTEPWAPTAREYRDLPWLRAALSFGLTLAAVFVFIAAFLLAYAHVHDGRVLPGVTVGGVSLAGLDRGAAEAKLREDLPPMHTGRLAVSLGSVDGSVAFADIGRDYDMPLMIEQALSVGRAGSLLDQAQAQLAILLHGSAIEPSVTWNSEELTRHVAALAASAEVTPVDAAIVTNNGGYVVEPAVVGWAVDAEQAVALAHAALADSTVTEASIQLDAYAIEPGISTATAEAAVADFERVSAEPLTIVGEGRRATIAANEIRGWTRLDETAPGEWAVIVASEPIVQFVELQALEIDRPAVDAGFTFDGEDIAAVRGETGLVVDVEASATDIKAALDARTGGGGSEQVSLSMVVIEPEFDYDQAVAVVSSMERLGRWRTNYQPGPLNYNGANIRIPTEKINGTILLPGETFDFWEVVGYPDEADGYGPGAAIIRGRTVPDGALAGGICSCSTTIFNAALRAGLEMGDRRNHYYYINRYPRGLDATVWISGSGQRQTVSFTNDMEQPILIRGINRRAAVIFEVWGVPDGRTVTLSDPRIDNRRPAFEVIRYTDNLRPGQTRRVEWPANGFDSWVTRTVRNASGQVIHEETYYSRYARIRGITLVGRNPGDPPHGTEIRRGGGSPEPPAEESSDG
jgi:vancomycin resistance protein YoaR